MGCTHDCRSCGHDCGSEQDFSKKLNEMSSVKKVIGVVSGKGGVGKSLVTSRCMPLEQEDLGATCVCCRKPAKHMIIWGKAY